MTGQVWISPWHAERSGFEHHRIPFTAGWTHFILVKGFSFLFSLFLFCVALLSMSLPLLVNQPRCWWSFWPFFCVGYGAAEKMTVKEDTMPRWWWIISAAGSARNFFFSGAVRGLLCLVVFESTRVYCRSHRAVSNLSFKFPLVFISFLRSLCFSLCDWLDRVKATEFKVHAFCPFALYHESTPIRAACNKDASLEFHRLSF